MSSKLKDQVLGQGRKGRVDATLDLLMQDRVDPLDVAVIGSQPPEEDRHQDHHDGRLHSLLITYLEIRDAERLLRERH